jgi:hypothetical protein
MTHKHVLIAAMGLVACAGGDDGRMDPTLCTTGTTMPMTDSGDEASACVPGTQIECPCGGGVQGVQACLPDGSGYDSCECTADGSGDGSGDSSSSGEPDPCGNGTCDADEDCNSCEQDCGVCEPCTLAPSCEGAEIPPMIETHADFLDDPMMAYVPPHEIVAMLQTHVEQATPAARLLAAALAEPTKGEPSIVASLRSALAAHPTATAAVRRQFAAVGLAAPASYRAAHPLSAAREAVAATELVAPTRPFTAPCDDPRLRVRVARLDVHEEDDDFANDEVYCAITAEASEAAEIKITPITPALDEGDSQVYSVDGGTVWGQSGLAAPKGNLLLTYYCIESDTSNGYADLVMAVGDAAMAANGVDIPGVDGWVFPTVGVVANLLAGALSLDGDDQLFNASQVVPEDQHVSLTQGAWWSVRRNGTHINSDWDWELRMEIWGCHDNAG